ncbi:unnamed protein product, partial [Musa banksii]
PQQPLKSQLVDRDSIPVAPPSVAAPTVIVPDVAIGIIASASFEAEQGPPRHALFSSFSSLHRRHSLLPPFLCLFLQKQSRRSLTIAPRPVTSPSRSRISLD